MPMKRALCLSFLALLSAGFGAGFAAAGDTSPTNPWSGQTGKWSQWHRFKVGNSSEYVYCYRTDCSGPSDRQGTVFQNHKNRAALYYLRNAKAEGNTSRLDAVKSPYSLAFDGKTLYAVQKTGGKEKRLQAVYAGFSGTTDVIVTVKPQASKPQTQKPPAPKPETGQAPNQGDPLRSKLEKLFSDPVEQAAAEHIILTSPGGAGAFLKADENAARGIAAGITSKIPRLVEGRLRKSGAPELKGLGQILALRGVTEKALIAYYCERTPEPSASSPQETPRPPAKQQLETMDQRNQQARTGPEETRKELAQVETRPSDPLIGMCDDYFAEKKTQGLDQAGSGGGTPSLTAQVPPISADKKPDPKGEKKGSDLPVEKMVVGAIGGAIVFGALAWAMGGPFGLVALLGALAMAAVVWFINK